MIEIFLKSYKCFYVDEEINSSNGNTYEIGERIGAGGNGAVYQGITQSGEPVAIKFLLRFDEKSKQRFSQEIKLMKKLHHPYIVEYIDDGEVELFKNKKREVNEKALFVIMELADTNLMDYLKQNKNVIRYDTYAPQFQGLSEALKNIHQFAIHRDIKPENILIKGGRWMLSDFGLCEFLNPEEHRDITGQKEKIGPIFWMSPEAVNHYYFEEDEIGTYSDVYQLGMIFAFILTRKYPGGHHEVGDLINVPPQIENVIIKAISNNYSFRQKNGGELFDEIQNATIGR